MPYVGFQGDNDPVLFGEYSFSMNSDGQVYRELLVFPCVETVVFIVNKSKGQKELP